MLMENCALVFGTSAKAKSNGVAHNTALSFRICDLACSAGCRELRWVERYPWVPISVLWFDSSSKKGYWQRLEWLVCMLRDCALLLV